MARVHGNGAIAVPIPAPKKRNWNKNKLIPIIITACLICGLIGSYFAFWQNTGSTVTNPPPIQSGIAPPVISTESEIDSDGDGMSDWFEENIANLDSLTPNDRYATIFNTVTEHPNPYYTKQRREETTNLKTFLIVEEKFKPENIFLFTDKEATYENFLRTMDYLAEISDENDLIYIFIEAHGAQTAFACHSGKDPSEFEISDEFLESVRGNYAWGYDEYWERGGKEEARKDQQIWLASTMGRGIDFNEINELISKIKYKKMLFVVEHCGAREFAEKIRGENLIIIGRQWLEGIADTLIRSIVSPDAQHRNLLYQSEEFRSRESSLIKLGDVNSYPSITEILAATIIDYHIKPWKTAWEQRGLDCEAILGMTNPREIIEKFTNFSKETESGTNINEIIPTMIEFQETADDFYFGEAKIGKYRETDLYLLSPQ